MTEPATIPDVNFGVLGFTRALVTASAAKRLGLPPTPFDVHVILRKESCDGEGGRIRTLTHELRKDLNRQVNKFMPTSRRIILRVRTAEFAKQHYRHGDTSLVGSGVMYLVVPDYCIGEFYDRLAALFLGFFPAALD